DQLLAEAARGKAAPALFRARAFLLGALADGPRTTRELWPLAREQRFSPRTLRRAKRDLGLRAPIVNLQGRREVFSHLPGQPLPPSIPETAVTPDFEDLLAPIRAQLAETTQLDDL